ncbi:MAG: hypothetical protein A3I16_05535 [Burkholderiales bacterium RIFCSPLOWO2_02_FULL_66_35]|nr:MAG: hypothetical protein A3I16_05535 [Burkholderiales bacterium RIFCSPLOWO2_02_FULL_66_35]
MPSLEPRIAKMEQTAAHVHLDDMTDAQLLDHAGTFPMFSRGMYAAVLTVVGRHPSAVPIVKDDPDHAALTAGKGGQVDIH